MNIHDEKTFKGLADRVKNLEAHQSTDDYDRDRWAINLEDRIKNLEANRLTDVKHVSSVCRILDETLEGLQSEIERLNRIIDEEAAMSLEKELDSLDAIRFVEKELGRPLRLSKEDPRWTYDEYTREDRLSTAKYYCKVCASGGDAESRAWVIYTHGARKDPYGFPCAQGNTTSKEKAMEAVEALVEILG